MLSACAFQEPRRCLCLLLLFNIPTLLNMCQRGGPGLATRIARAFPDIPCAPRPHRNQLEAGWGQLAEDLGIPSPLGGDGTATLILRLSLASSTHRSVTCFCSQRLAVSMCFTFRGPRRLPSVSRRELSAGDRIGHLQIPEHGEVQNQCVKRDSGKK